LQAEIAALPTLAVTRNVDGSGVIETYSVRYDWPERTGIIIGRLDADDSRFMAITTDEDLVTLMSDGEPLGTPINVKCDAEGVNRATLA
jgi:acetyl-CoA C-acetyltransferase